MDNTNFVIFPKAYQSKAHGQHTSMTQKCNGIVWISDLWSWLLRKALEHVLRETLGTEDITIVNRHVE